MKKKFNFTSNKEVWIKKILQVSLACQNSKACMTKKPNTSSMIKDMGK